MHTLKFHCCAYHCYMAPIPHSPYLLKVDSQTFPTIPQKLSRDRFFEPGEGGAVKPFPSRNWAPEPKIVWWWRASNPYPLNEARVNRCSVPRGQSAKTRVATPNRFEDPSGGGVHTWFPPKHEALEVRPRGKSKRIHYQWGEIQRAGYTRNSTWSIQ